MKKMLLTFSILTLILLVCPIIVWLLNWQWHIGQAYYQLDNVLYWITETGSAPIYAAISSVILTGLLLQRCYGYFSWKVIFIMIISIHLGGQAIKTGLKQITQEPRPYMQAIMPSEEEQRLFYQTSRQTRANQLGQLLQTYPDLPTSMKTHWQHETGYAFPSGHTLFAASWLLLFAGFLSYRLDTKNILIIAILTIWAILMILSRLRLGMHYPIDLLTSIIIAFFLNVGGFTVLANKHHHNIETNLRS